jgi:hypothetical protein
MTDFLSSLLVRNTSTEPGEESLHPRLRSRFETPPVERGPGEGDLGADSEPPPSRPEPRALQPTDSAAVGTRPVESLPERQTMPAPRPPALPGEPSRPVLPGSTGMPPQRDMPHFERRELGPRPAEKTDPTVRPAEVRPAWRETLPAHRAAVQAHLTPTAPDARVERVEVERSSLEEGMGLGRMSPADSTRASTLQPARGAESTFPKLALERKSEATPVIHVSIGRVEVRAVQPNAAPARAQARKESPIVSLEEHLRRRGGEG